MQITHNATEGRVGVANPFSQYVKYLPGDIPLPTFWNENEKALLEGTSLEEALNSKLKTLDREFSLLLESTSTIPWCQQNWRNAEAEQLTLDDWKYVDAVYRSRALDLPKTGHYIVPCIDMANHASGLRTNALYETDPHGNAILILRSETDVTFSEEIRITYGDAKGACEMLFSYGLIEEGTSSARELFLDLDIPDDDPLRLAKKLASKSAPGFRLFELGDGADWEGTFVWLICVNEEDGLEFKSVQSIDGGREIHVTWKDQEVEDLANLQELLVQDHMWDVFKLRATTVIQTRVEQQLIRLQKGEQNIERNQQSSDIRTQQGSYSMELRDLEETLLLKAYEVFEDLKTSLLESAVVQNYLSTAQEEFPVTEDDFS